MKLKLYGLLADSFVLLIFFFFKGIEKTEENKLSDKDARLRNEKASIL